MTSRESEPGMDAPHFTREMIQDTMRHVRGDLAASLSGEGANSRERSRLEAARRLGLDKVAAEAIAAIDDAIEHVQTRSWPGGMDQRYMGLIGTVDTMARISTELMPHDDKHAHLTELSDVMGRAMLMAGSAARARRAEHLKALYVIVDPELTNGRDPEWVAQQALAGGATALQLRMGSADKGDWLEVATRIREQCDEAGAILIVNGHSDVAVAARAHGVHLGQHDLSIAAARSVLQPWQVAGTSNSLVEDARSACDAGADFIAVGPMFPTDNPDRRVAGPEMLREVRALIPEDGPPIVGFGGTTPANVGEIARAGADGICVTAAVTGADDPRAAAADLLAAFQKA